MIFWLVLKLEISDRVLIRILVSFRGIFLKMNIFFHGEIFEFP
jgi:hypothetical protein